MGIVGGSVARTLTAEPYRHRVRYGARTPHGPGPSTSLQVHFDNSVTLNGQAALTVDVVHRLQTDVADTRGNCGGRQNTSPSKPPADDSL